jgi:hypothetical protein
MTKLLSVLFLTSNIFGVALSLIFSFTNGEDWDGLYRLQFQVPKPLKNKPIEFFNEVSLYLHVHLNPNVRAYRLLMCIILVVGLGRGTKSRRSM